MQGFYKFVRHRSWGGRTLASVAANKGTFKHPSQTVAVLTVQTESPQELSAFGTQ